MHCSVHARSLVCLPNFLVCCLCFVFMVHERPLPHGCRHLTSRRVSHEGPHRSSGARALCGQPARLVPCCRYTLLKVAEERHLLPTYLPSCFILAKSLAKQERTGSLFAHTRSQNFPKNFCRPVRQTATTCGVTEVGSLFDDVARGRSIDP